MANPWKRSRDISVFPRSDVDSFDTDDGEREGEGIKETHRENDGDREEVTGYVMLFYGRD